MLLSNSLKLLRGSTLRSCLHHQYSVRWISPFNKADLLQAQEWKSNLNNGTIKRKLGKVSSTGVGGKRANTSAMLRYPVKALLSQVPAIIHQDTQKFANAAGDIVIRAGSHRTRRENEEDAWLRLMMMVKTAADMVIPEKIDDDRSFKSFQFQEIVRTSQSQKEIDNAKRELLALRQAAMFGKTNEKTHKLGKTRK